MAIIQAVPIRDLRNNYGEVEEMINNHNVVWITKNGRNSAVLINPEDYEEYENYKYDKFVAGKIKEAEKSVASHNAKWHVWEDVLKEMREKYLV